MTEPISGATKDQVSDYLMRHKRYDNIDGTSEMFFGLMYLAFASIRYVSAVMPRNSFFEHSFAGMMLVMYGTVLPVLCLGLWGGMAIKKRVTWPRTGYMAPRKVTRSSIPALVFAFGTAVVVAAGLFLVVRFGKLHNAVMIPRTLGLTLVVATYAFLVFRLSKEHPWKRFVVLLLAASLAGYAIAIPGGFNTEFFQPVMVFTGIVWLASGGITLYLYIRRTQPPAPESE